MLHRRVLILTSGVLLGALVAVAEPKKAAFAPHERVAIQGYFQAYPKALPPGLQKQLWERGELPPGLQKRIMPFPRSLEVRLAPPAPGLRRGCLGDRAILYDPATLLIVDSFVISVQIGP